METQSATQPAAPVPDPHAEKRRGDAAHAARGGVVQLLGVIAQLLMPFYMGLVKRLFGPVVFGYYAGTFPITEILIRLGVGGADRGMHRFIAGHRAAGEEALERQALGTALRLSLGITVVLALAVVFLAGPLGARFGRPALALTLPYMAPALVAQPLMFILVAATLARRTARMSFLVRGFLEPGMLIVCGLAAFGLGLGISGLATAHGLAYVLIALGAALGAAMVFGGRNFLAALRSPRHPTFARFALPAAFSDTAGVLFQRTDMLVLPLFVGPEAVGAYFVAEMLARVSANVRYAFDGIAAPVLSEALALHDRARLRYNLRLLTRWVTTLSLPLATTMIALREPLLLLYGRPTLVASSIVVIHTFGHLLSGTLGLAGHVVIMSGRSRLFLANQLGATALNATLCFVLVPRLGITGAAISVASSLGAMMAATLIEVWVLERVHPFHAALLKPLTAAGAALAAQLTLVRVLPAAAAIPAVVLAGALTYLLVFVALRPPAEEREVLEGALARVRGLFGGGR